MNNNECFIAKYVVYVFNGFIEAIRCMFRWTQNKERWINILDASLAVFIAGILASGVVNVLGLDGEHNVLLHPYIKYVCFVASLLVLWVKECLDPKVLKEEEKNDNTDV